jgi:hypothetical protein
MATLNPILVPNPHLKLRVWLGGSGGGRRKPLGNDATNTIYVAISSLSGAWWLLTVIVDYDLDPFVLLDHSQGRRSTNPYGLLNFFLVA